MFPVCIKMENIFTFSHLAEAFIHFTAVWKGFIEMIEGDFSFIFLSYSVSHPFEVKETTIWIFIFIFQANRNKTDVNKYYFLLPLSDEMMSTSFSLLQAEPLQRALNAGHASTCCSALTPCSHRSAATLLVLSWKWLPTLTRLQSGGQRAGLILTLTAELHHSAAATLPGYSVNLTKSVLWHRGLWGGGSSTAAGKKTVQRIQKEDKKLSKYNFSLCLKLSKTYLKISPRKWKRKKVF